MSEAAMRTPSSVKAYDALEAYMQPLGAMLEAMHILHWDSAVMMPETAATVRGEQLAALEGILHEKLTAPQMGEWLDEAESNAAQLDGWQQANVTEIRRRWLSSNALPAKLVEAKALATSKSEVLWRSARKNNDFTSFLPAFEQVINIVREEAQAKAELLKLAPYDALMEDYDPGTRMAEVDPIFDKLAAFLPDFREQAITFQNENVTYNELKGRYPIEKQKLLSDKLMRKLGFEGRLDISTHPFCGGALGDTRITTRYSETDFVDALQGVLHETGHALYQQNLPLAWRHQPVGNARGMATHESQSLLVEMQLCRSREFLTFAEPLIREILDDGQGDDLSVENLYRLGTRVVPDFIRVRADEVTYPSHVILRYRLEKAIINGELEGKDLPEAWNAMMQEMLGITPPTDALGCLQDIHWPSGSFGYFPTYSLGAMMAAQWMAAIKRDIPDVMDQAAKGEFEALVAWLDKHVHSQACRHTRQELLQSATGEGLNVDIYLAHLKERYLN